MYLSEKDFKTTATYLDSFDNEDWTTFSSVRLSNFIRYFIVNKHTGDILPVDIMSAIHFKGLKLLSDEFIFSNVESYRQMTVANRLLEDKVIYIKCCILRLQKKPIIKYKDQLKLAFENNIDPLYEDISPLFGLVKLLGKTNYSFTSQFNNFSRYVFSWIKSKFNRQSKMYLNGGLFISLIGPDGAGKTEASNYIMKTFEEHFEACNYFHGKPGILPPMSSFLSRIKGKSSTSSTSSTSKPNRTKVTTARYLINLLYYVCDFFIFGFVLMNLKKSNNVVVFDRYFHDYFLHPEYKDCPKFIAYFLRRLIPSPDINIIIDSDVKNILSRKEELSENEINVFYDAVSIYESNTENCYRVYNNSDIESFRKEIFNAICLGNRGKK